MQLDSQPDPAASPISADPVPPKSNLIAPVWHTVMIVAVVLGNSLIGSSKMSTVTSPKARIILYSGTFIFELLVVVLIWFWIRRSGVSMGDLIGGRWESVESFLLDVALAIGFLVVASIVLVGVRVALGTLDLHHMDKQLEETKRMLGPLIPRSTLEAALFVLLSVAAGLFEEIIFRGYLQRQIGAIAGNAYVGIVVSAAIFGAGHGYQGGRMMVAIGVFGTMFGLLAHFRKSLRPGMMAHASQDAYAGLALFFLAR